MSTSNTPLRLTPKIEVTEAADTMQPSDAAQQSVEIVPAKQPTVVTNYAATAKQPAVAATETAAAPRNPETEPAPDHTASVPQTEDAPQPEPSAVATKSTKNTPGPLARLFSFGKPRPRAEIEVLSTEETESAARTNVADKGPRRRSPRASGGEGLPGVRDNLFGVGESKDGSTRQPVLLASAAGLARLAPNGLRRQHDAVNTACLKPKLVTLLAQVRRHYGRDVVITSGFRSAKHQRRIGGVRASRHTTCEAADIQVPGVGKWELAKYLRSVRGRGGVGTYCHTRSVHIDVGRKRDWNWRCKRR